MKALSLVSALVLMTSFSALAKGTISLGQSPAGTAITISMDESDVLGQKLVQALLESPLVKEVNNIYVEPGTRFDGPGFTLTLSAPSGPRSLTLMFTAKPEDQNSLVLEGNFLRISGERGPVRSIHQALLASRSSHVLTKRNPGRIIPEEGQAVILEVDHYGGADISCSEGFRNSQHSTCSFELKK